jgi:MoxR-like ATPase
MSSLSASRASTFASSEHVRATLRQAVDAVSGVVLGQRQAVTMAMAAMLARGHILFEDVPGVGKTTLARALARVLGCTFARVQFTADMLPSDVLGVQVLDPRSGELRFRQGPIFAQLVLADEINRASPKTQSAMLEAMAERRVTIDETSHELGSLFTVIATQNPLEHHGAYPLPESQLDRFMVRLSLGYPPEDEERRLVLAPATPEQALAALGPALDEAALSEAQQHAARVLVSEPVADYLLAIVRATRRHPEVVTGASPRAAMSLAAVARASALLAGRNFVLPDDVQELAQSVLGHRLVLATPGAPDAQRRATAAVINDILERTAVPR